MTMIRINLLPVRQTQKRELGRQFLVLAAIVLVGTIGGNFAWVNSRVSVGDRLQAENAGIQQRIAALEKEIGEVNDIKRQRAEIQAKLDALNTLRASRQGPVRMLDALALATPKKVWLGEFSEASSSAKFVGSALTLDDVSELMRGLSNVVWTAKGMGRLIERRRDTPTMRVEIFAPEGVSVEEFPASEVKFFFKNVELRTSAQANQSAGGRVITFELNAGANYAI